MNKAIKVKGMSCQHCATAVTRAMTEVAGVARVEIDLTAGTASYSETQPVDLAALKAAIAKAGYQVVD